MPYNSILGYIFLSLSLSIMVYLQYNRNKPDKTIKTLKAEISLTLLGLIFSLIALSNFILSIIKYIRLFSFHIR